MYNIFLPWKKKFFLLMQGRLKNLCNKYDVILFYHDFFLMM
jgi:hypothetical protein